MTGTWIGKNRSVGLWSNINTYVQTYTAVNDISTDEPWLKRWNELITVHKILKKKREYEFIAYVITGNPESTVEECLTTLFSFIPFLDQHIEITATNDNGNIQYTYHPESFQPKLQTDQTSDIPEDTNPFASLRDDEDKDEKDLDSILKSSDHDTDEERTNDPNDVYTQALTAATSTLQQLSDYTTPDHRSTMEDYITEIESLHKSALDNSKTKFDELTSNTESILQELHQTLSDDFKSACDKYYNEKLITFNSTIDRKLALLDKVINEKLTAATSKIHGLGKSVTPTRPKPTKPFSVQSPIRSSNTPVKPFGATKTDVTTPSIQNYFHQNLKFEHQADVYYLQDRDFLKNSPKIETPVSVEDGLTLYSQLQKNALIYNIFITPIDKIDIWDMAPNTVPTTCNLEIDDHHNFLQTYQRSAVAIYTKLQHTNFSSVPFFQQILNHERTSQDGYKVLYGMLCICHPKLVEKPRQNAPTLEPNGSLFTFIRKYTNYIESERIANRKYTDLEQLSFIMNVLESDGRFDKALHNLRLHKNMFEELSKTNVNAKFPPSLTLDILPYTIMKSFTTEEKNELFTDPNNNITPIVNVVTRRNNARPNNNPTPQRKRVNKTCQCCGISGHDIHNTGCDFAASMLLSNDFLKTHSHMKRKILQNFKSYQAQRLNNMMKKESLATRITRSAQEKRIGITPTVKLLIEAIADNIEDTEHTTSPQDDDVLDITDILADTNMDNDDPDNYHDTSDQLPTTSK